MEFKVCSHHLVNGSTGLCNSCGERVVKVGATSKCDFPNCQETTHHYDPFFRKWNCEKHSFDKVVWPSLKNEYLVTQRSKQDEADRCQDLDNDISYRKRKSINRNKQSKWGKNFFKKKFL